MAGSRVRAPDAATVDIIGPIPSARPARLRYLGGNARIAADGGRTLRLRVQCAWAVGYAGGREALGPPTSGPLRARVLWAPASPYAPPPARGAGSRISPTLRERGGRAQP